jgi:hypothetical protein
MGSRTRRECTADKKKRAVGGSVVAGVECRGDASLPRRRPHHRRQVAVALTSWRRRFASGEKGKVDAGNSPSESLMTSEHDVIRPDIGQGGAAMIEVGADALPSKGGSS